MVNKYCNGSLFNISLIGYSKNLCSGTLKVYYEVVMKKQEYSVCPQEYSVILDDLLDP